MNVQVIESNELDGVEWGISLSSHNPEPEDYFPMDEKTAFRLAKRLNSQMTISEVLKSIEKYGQENPQSAQPYPIVGVLQDGTIIENGQTGGVYESTGLTWEMDKDLQAQKQSVQDYFKELMK